jgi:polygalacturonase
MIQAQLKSNFSPTFLLSFKKETDVKEREKFNLKVRPKLDLSCACIKPHLRIRGVRIKNSPTFHIVMNMCKNVHVERIGIKALQIVPTQTEFTWRRQTL